MHIHLLSRGRGRRAAVAALATVVAFAAAAVVAYAKGGAGKPPAGAVAPWVTPTLPDPAFTVSPALIHGFDVTGFIQDATVSRDNAACPDVTDPARRGGTVTLKGVQIVVPCDFVVQMPANTLRWAGMAAGGRSLALGRGWPSFEIRAIGNIVDGAHIAGLLFASQQAANAQTGTIRRIDYATGNLEVDTGDPDHPAVVQLNDPNGRFGRAQSADPRFTVDDANPTVHAATGYPMCVPRTDPARSDDPLCPQRNRPAPPCRNFSQAGVAPPIGSGELSPPAPDQKLCSQFVMPAPPAGPGITDGPDARQQAAFEVGDTITYS